MRQPLLQIAICRTNDQEFREQLKGKTRERFDKLTDSNRELKSQVDALEPRAGIISDLLDNYGLTPQEIDQGHDLMVKLKTHPQEAVQNTFAYLQEVCQKAGITPPWGQEAPAPGRLTKLWFVCGTRAE